MSCVQIYDQIYLDSLAAKAGYPFVATNYTSPILHSVELPRLKPSTTYASSPLLPISVPQHHAERFSATALPVVLQRLHDALVCCVGLECIGLLLSHPELAYRKTCLICRNCPVSHKIRRSMRNGGLPNLWHGRTSVLHCCCCLCRFYYRVGDGTTWSTTYSFTTFLDVSQGEAHRLSRILIFTGTIEGPGCRWAMCGHIYTIKYQP